ncbi:MAG: hypothetical protein MUC30_04570 [Bacteroidales bacterium]|nr:hypothetical protein [Bacteroidales bacterium]
MRSALLRIETRLPHAIVAARNPAISMSSLEVKRWGMLTGSSSMNALLQFFDSVTGYHR